MKFFITAMVLAQISAGLAFSQNVQKVGGWYVYSSSNGAAKQVTLLQSTSEEHYTNNMGQPVEAQMDVVCMKGKIAAVAIDTNSIVPKRSINESGPMETTLVSYQLGGEALRSESWGIFDRGRTLSPYAEILQGRRNREWFNRIAHSDEIVLHFEGSNTARRVTTTFHTAGFDQALSAAQCIH